MSHLATTIGGDSEPIERAIERFNLGVELIYQAGFDPRYIHLAKTAATIRADSDYTNTVRIGEGMYGINPFSRGHRLHGVLAHALQPARRFLSTVVCIREVAEGEPIGYGGAFVVPKGGMRIGVLPAGLYERN